MSPITAIILIALSIIPFASAWNYVLWPVVDCFGTPVAGFLSEESQCGAIYTHYLLTATIQHVITRLKRMRLFIFCARMSDGCGSARATSRASPQKNFMIPSIQIHVSPVLFESRSYPLILDAIARL